MDSSESSRVSKRARLHPPSNFRSSAQPARPSSLCSSIVSLADLDENAVTMNFPTLSSDGRRVRTDVRTIVPQGIVHRERLPPGDQYLELEGLILDNPVENSPLVDVVATKRKRYQSSVSVSYRADIARLSPSIMLAGSPPPSLGTTA